jgi:hypothetical protein
MKRPKLGIGMGVAFILMGLTALPWALADPTGTTPRGLPLWVLPPMMVAGGAFFVVYSCSSLVRRKR